jgi:hypothetical protein
LESAYHTNFENGSVGSVTRLANVSRYIPGWVIFDVEIDATGQTLYLSDGTYDDLGGPHEADLAIAQKVNGEFQRLSNSDDILRNINTATHLEYAAGISADNLELYFTRVLAPLTPQSKPEIWVATRASTDDAFGMPVKIESPTAFAEAPSLSPDGERLYYHMLDGNGMFSLYFTERSH